MTNNINYGSVSRAMKRKQLNGVQPSFILLLTPVLLPVVTGPKQSALNASNLSGHIMQHLVLKMGHAPPGPIGRISLFIWTFQCLTLVLAWRSFL